MFLRPVVAPRTQSKMSPGSAKRVGEIVHCTGVGLIGPNSVGPLSNGTPRPSELYDAPGGDWPIVISHTSPNLTQRQPSFKGSRVTGFEGCRFEEVKGLRVVTLFAPNLL